MERARVDRLAAFAARTEDRRSALRLLAAAVAGSAGLSGFAAERTSAGRNKGRGGKGKGNEDRCRSGKLLDAVQVPADGSPVETKPLARGQKVVLRVSGFIEDDEWGLDGEYYFKLATPNDPAEVYDRCFDSTPVGLAIAGFSPGGWGPYTADHAYERTVTGQGAPLSLRLSDCRYEDQTGSLTVEVRCA